MIPLILVCPDEKEIKVFLKSFISKNIYSADRITEIFPLKKEIVISQIKEVIRQISISVIHPRLFIFHKFDQANLEAQNAFLKSLEDGTANNQFILIVRNEYQLLPTVRSRSVITKIKNSVNSDKKAATTFDFLAKVESATDYKFLTNSLALSSSSEDVIEISEDIIHFYHKKMAKDANAIKIIKKAMNYRSLLQNNNINPQLALDNLLIFIFKAFRMKL